MTTKKIKIMCSIAVLVLYTVFSAAAGEFDYLASSFISNLDDISDVTESPEQHSSVVLPKQSEVMIVGKISAILDEDTQFYGKTRNVQAGKLNTPPVICIDGNAGEPQRQLYSDGEFFFVVYKLPRDRHLQFESFPYYLFADKKTRIILPLYCSIDVPPDVNYVYIGSFTYTVTGDNFTVSKVTSTDEYDQAKEAVTRLSDAGKINLCRVEIKDHDEVSQPRSK
jgi:hypothetical protein